MAGTPKIFHRKKGRRYRIDKRHYANRQRVDITTETPTHRITDTFTAEYKQESKKIPKKESGNWETPFDFYGLKVRYSKSEDRYYLFFEDQYLREITRLSMYDFADRMFGAVGAFRFCWYKKKGRKYYQKKELIGRSRWRKQNGVP